MKHWSWKTWTALGFAAAWVALVVTMIVSEEVLLMVGWLTPIGLVFLAITGIFVAAAIKYLRQSKN